MASFSVGIFPFPLSENSTFSGSGFLRLRRLAFLFVVRFSAKFPLLSLVLIVLVPEPWSLHFFVQDFFSLPPREALDGSLRFLELLVLCQAFENNWMPRNVPGENVFPEVFFHLTINGTGLRNGEARPRFPGRANEAVITSDCPLCHWLPLLDGPDGNERVSFVGPNGILHLAFPCVLFLPVFFEARLIVLGIKLEADSVLFFVQLHAENHVGIIGRFIRHP
jgi:hypothetical protein